MRKRSRNVMRVLAIDPGSRGFGFAIVEWPLQLIDWGVKSARTTKRRPSSKVDDLVKKYRPTILLLENCDKNPRRRANARAFARAIHKMAKDKRIAVRLIRADRVKQVFGAFHAQTKSEIACAVAKQLPELASILPRVRKPWMTEDYRMSIFDAAALALTYMYTRSTRGKSGSQHVPQ